MIGSLGQPILFLLALRYGFGPVFQKAGQGNYLEFLAPGVIAMTILFTAIYSGIEIIWDKQFGFLKETLVAPVSRLNIMVGRTLGGATVATIQGIIVFCISIAAGFRPTSLAFLPVALLIMNFLVMPIFFLSDALFPLERLPGSIFIAASLNPLTYGVDGLRGALGGEMHFGFGIDLAVLTGVTAPFLVIGSYLFSKIEI
jgi:ABC-2 type transport system permease protein